MNSFTLLSNDIQGQIDIKHTYGLGENISPHLTWINAPKETKSFAITLYDPDAPTGSGWWHWQVVNIDTDCNTIKRNGSKEIPLASQGLNDYGFVGYGGPHPPKGDKAHSYIFTIYALNISTIVLTKETSAASLSFLINKHMIKKASIITYYHNI